MGEAADSKMTGSEFEDDDQTPGSSMMPFSELLSDPEKDEGQDPPSSTTGDSGEKPNKRANQGRTESAGQDSSAAGRSFLDDMKER